MESLETDPDQTVTRADSLETMLGWNTAAIFEPGKYEDDGGVSVTTTTEIIVLTDPYPEYKRFVFKDGEFWHTVELMPSTYENIFEEALNSYGEAVIQPLSEIDCIQRDQRNIPQYTE